MASRTNLAESDVAHQSYPVRSEPFDDMHDHPQGPQSPLPAKAISEIISRFKAADDAARHSQFSYQLLALSAALLGAVAVIAAVFEIYHAHGTGVTALELCPTAVEFVAAIAAVVSWVMMRRHKYSWLAQRHQTERYRQMKYRLLLRPEYWIDVTKPWVTPDWMNDELQEIAKVQTRESLEGIIKDEPPHGPFEIATRILPRGNLRHLVEYYLAKRLNPQIAYLANRVQGNEYKDLFLRGLAWLFSISVVAAAIHGFLHLNFFIFARKGWRLPSVLESIEIVALLAAAILPVMAATIRTLRAAFEFSRNKSRFSAAQGALFNLQYRLVDAGFTSVPVSLPGDSEARHPVIGITRGSPSPVHVLANTDDDWIDGDKALQTLHWCEHILATEHIEWLRLMMETELFG